MTLKVIFHPSLITYDTKKVFTWSKYKKRRDHNKMVKRFRDIIGCKEKREEWIEEARKKRDFIFNISSWKSDQKKYQLQKLKK